MIVDISRWQGAISQFVFQAWAAAGVTEVILKVGGGDSGRYEDSKYAQNSANARAAGLVVSGYWFNGTTDPAGDAQFCASLLAPGERCWADVESEGSMPHWSDDQADVFEAYMVASGHPSGTYMSASVTFGGWPKCSKRPLWVAGYGFTSVPSVGAWGAPVLWQYTSTGHLPGYGGNLDLDQPQTGFASTTATPLAAPPVVPPIGDTDMKYIWTQNRGGGIVGPNGFLSLGPEAAEIALALYGPAVTLSDRQFDVARQTAIDYAALRK